MLGMLGMAPVGFRFHPTDEELVDHYLKLKILGMDSHVDIIPEVYVCKWEPWDLPGIYRKEKIISEFLSFEYCFSLYCVSFCFVQFFQWYKRKIQSGSSSVLPITNTLPAVVRTGQQKPATGNPPVRIGTLSVERTKNWSVRRKL